MDLIKKVYENNNDNCEQLRPFLYFGDIDDINKLRIFLKYTRCFDTDLSYVEVDYNLTELFGKLGFCDDDSICLHNMTIGHSRYDIDKEGYCVFNYSVNALEYNDGDTLEYYSSSELFDGNDLMYPGVKLSSDNIALYYTVGTGPYIKKYEIKVNDNLTLTREFSKDEVLFILNDKEDNSFVIRIKKPKNMVVTNNYVLDNELGLVEYLKTIESYDIVSIYNMLCKLSLGNNVSIYSEITLSELITAEYGVCDENLLTIKNGNLDCIIRTIGDKTLTLYGNGNWNYVLSDENVDFRIKSGKTLRYGIETKSDKVMADYTDSLLKYDVSVAKKEVEDTKRLVREKFGLSVKKRG